MPLLESFEIQVTRKHRPDSYSAYPPMFRDNEDANTCKLWLLKKKNMQALVVKNMKTIFITNYALIKQKKAKAKCRRE